MFNCNLENFNSKNKGQLKNFGWARNFQSKKMACPTHLTH